MVYIMNDGHPFGSPSDYYLDTIMEGYQSAGFDTEFLEKAVEKSIRLAREQKAQEPDQGTLFDMKWW
jgi:uncharacterized protein (UPF0335 family)